MLTKTGLFLFLLTVLQVSAIFRDVVQSAASVENEINPEHLTVSSSSSRIVSGWVAQPGQFPHHASLRTVNANGAIGTCGGSIVSREWVFSAASCSARRTALVVRAGVLSLTDSDSENIFETTEWYIHPRYNERSSNVQPNDISLIKLQRPVVYSRLLQPIRVQSLADANRNYDGQLVVASGHGMTGSSGGMSEWLRWVNLRAMSNSACSRAYWWSNIIVRTTICARFFNVTSQSLCRGDGGAPLVHVGADGIPTLIGIGSFWSNTCSYNQPSGFTRPGPYLSWIQDVTGIDFENLQEEEETTTTITTTIQPMPEVDITNTTTTSTTAQPDDSDDQEPDATAQPGDSEEQGPTTIPDDDETQEPDTTGQPDDSEEQEPDTTAEPDDSEEQEPDNITQPDDSKEQGLSTTAEPDDSDEQEPDSTAHPDDSEEQGLSTAEPDDSEEQEPDTTAQPDNSEEQDLSTTTKPDDSEEQEPDPTAQPDDSEEQGPSITVKPDDSEEKEPDTITQPDDSEEQGLRTTAKPDDSEEQKPDTITQPDDSEEQGLSTTAKPDDSEDLEPDTTAQPDDSEEQGPNTTTRPDDSVEQEPDDASPGDEENEQKPPEDSEEEAGGEENDSDSSESKEDDEIGQLLKHLEVFVKVKVRLNKYKTKNELGKIKHIKHH